MGVLQAEGSFDEVSLYGTLIHVVAEGVEARRTQIETALREAGVEIHDMNVIPPSLEDVFIASVRDKSESQTGASR
jgi:hypothetical protein